jgi:hypothetical protein
MNLLNNLYGLFSFDMGIDLGTPHYAYLLSWSTSMHRKSASAGRVVFEV